MMTHKNLLIGMLYHITIPGHSHPKEVPYQILRTFSVFRIHIPGPEESLSSKWYLAYHIQVM